MSSVKDTITSIKDDDFVMVIVAGCIKKITKADFIKGITLGGFSIIESWINSIEGIGLFSDGNLLKTDTPPTMQDIFLNVENRVIGKLLPSDEFINRYYDADGDKFGKVIITGGDVSGWYFNDMPLEIGQVIDAEDLLNGKIKYNARDTDQAYAQEWFFEVYDENNIKAI